MTQQGQPAAAVPASHMDTDSVWAVLLPSQLPAKVWEKLQMAAPVGTLPPTWQTWKKPLALAWPALAAVDILGGESQDGSSLSLSLTFSV